MFAKKIINFFCLVVAICLASSSMAAGVTKKLKYTIDNRQFGGYVASPKTGWVQYFQYNILDATGKMAVISRESGSSVVPPDPSYLTILDGTGKVLSKESLPFQIQSQDCYDSCPSMMLDFWFSPFSNKYHIRGYYSIWSASESSRAQYDYILDTSVAVGKTGRWTKLSGGKIKSGSHQPSLLYQVSTPPGFMFQVDDVANPGYSTLYQIQ